MHFIQGEPTQITFDNSDELQALGWACSDMRRANPDDEQTVSAYGIALRGTEVRHNQSDNKDFPLVGEEADVVLSVLRQWVELGPPAKEGQVTDAARAKSYKTAQSIVTQVTELTQAER